MQWWERCCSTGSWWRGVVHWRNWCCSAGSRGGSWFMQCPSRRLSNIIKIITSSTFQKKISFRCYFTSNCCKQFCDITNVNKKVVLCGWKFLRMYQILQQHHNMCSFPATAQLSCWSLFSEHRIIWKMLISTGTRSSGTAEKQRDSRSAGKKRILTWNSHSISYQRTKSCISSYIIAYSVIPYGKWHFAAVRWITINSYTLPFLPFTVSMQFSKT